MASQLPRITIILPIRNEIQFIENTLSAVLNQDYPTEKTQILIADGDSTDSTSEFLQEIVQEHSRIQIINNPGKIVSTGFNLALNHAIGDIIIRVDGHTTISPDYFRKCVEALRDVPEACNTGGRLTVVKSGIIPEATAAATSSRFGVGNAQFHYLTHPEWVETVYLGAWRRRVFSDYGGFDEELVRNQEDEFNFRLRQNGEKIWLDPSIKSQYHPRDSLLKLFSQYYQYGLYKVRVIQKRGDFSSWRHLIPGSFALCLLVFTILAIAGMTVFPITVLGGVYLLANLIATAVTAIRIGQRTIVDKTKIALVLPFTFFTLHFSYGLGFLMGLTHFWNKWGDTQIKDNHFDKALFNANTTKASS